MSEKDSEGSVVISLGSSVAEFPKIFHHPYN